MMYTNANSGSLRTGWCKSAKSNPSQNCVEIRVDGQVARIRDRISESEMGMPPRVSITSGKSELLML